MKCPKCQELELKSVVFVGLTSTTLSGYFSYYDEEGNHHHHDKNDIVTHYTCSNGHKFIGIMDATDCPSYPENCDFGGFKEEIRIIEENPPLDME